MPDINSNSSFGRCRTCSQYFYHEHEHPDTYWLTRAEVVYYLNKLADVRDTLNKFRMIADGL